MQSILKRLETPYSDDMEDAEASFPQAATAEPSPFLADHRERTPFNVYNKHKNLNRRRTCSICDFHDPLKLLVLFQKIEKLI